MGPEVPTALQSPPLKLSIVLNAAVVLRELFLGVLEIVLRLPCGLMYAG